ncbi:MAG: glucose-6-phosphate isomerase [Kosmotogales bacterium]|nr:glucose-6-phosphate isomerase [Kosmotogales bacterium]
MKYSFTYALKENINEGISIEDIKNFQEKVDEAFDYVIKNDPAFIKLIKTDKYIEEVLELSEWIEKFDTIVVLGIGGSALGNLALHTSLKPLNWNIMSDMERKNKCRVFVLDNVDPDFVNSFYERLNPEKTLFNVISKSGTTAECMSNYLIAKKYIEDSNLKVSDHLVFTTDPEKGILREISKEENIKTLTIPPEIGGRFSVLTPVGLLSALSEGIDIKELYDGARKALDKFKKLSFFENPVKMNIALNYLYYKADHNISVMMSYSNRLFLLADWFRQLWGESLGKKFDLQNEVVKVGLTPVKALGVVDQHSQIQLYNEGPNDKLITFLQVEKFDKDMVIPIYHSEIEALSCLSNKKISKLLNSELKGTILSLSENGVPSITLSFEEINEKNVGEFIFFYELTTAVMGKLMNINPYDQPGVELGKKYTYAFMGRKGYENILAESKKPKLNLEL